jgi:hypothetical protein
VLDLEQQSKTLLAEEEFTIPNAHVHREQRSVLDQVDHPIHAIRVTARAREEVAEARRNGEERDRLPYGGYGRRAERSVAADADQERVARAARRRPVAQAVEVGKELELRLMSAGPKGVAEPECLATGATVAGAWRRDDLDRARPGPGASYP